MDATTRIATLRQRLLERKDPAALQHFNASAVVTARSLRDSAGCASWQERKGLLVRDRLSAVEFELDELELLAGRPRFPVPDEADAELAAARRYLDGYHWPGGQTGHCELDVGPLMQMGLDGLAAEIRGRLGRARGEAGSVYRSCLHALEGLSTLISNAGRAAEAAMAGASTERRRELAEIAASCRRIAHAPPRTFRDALQLLWFVIFGVMHGDSVWLVGPGHLDRTLAPFYERDRAAGRLTPEQALLLIENLYLLLNAYIPDGLAIPVMVGGRDAEGRDVTNELSYLALEALRRTKLVYPTVGICWHADTPAALVDLAVELIGKGYPNPAFFSDAVIQQGLRALGVPASESHAYINSTCVEITPCGASNVWVASPYYNLCQLLLEEIAAQVARPAASFADFITQYRRRVAEAIARGVTQQNQLRKERREYGRKPLQSVFTRDCLGRGRDIDDGGAIYNWVECSFVGLANLADALKVVDEEIFRQQRLDWAELKAVLDADFAGAEAVRQRFLNAYPKYGQNNPQVDGLVRDTAAFLVAECRRFRMEPDGSPYVPGAFVWIMHELLGRETGATPDGRKAGTPFADGGGPAQGRERRGPTAAILSTTSWDHSPMIGGLAYNMKFNPALFRNPTGFDRLRDLVLTYLRRGGFELQINVVDGATLRAARAHPEAYRDLVVRIGGYTDYFARLSPQMQEEIIRRTEFDNAD